MGIHADHVVRQAGRTVESRLPRRGRTRRAEPCRDARWEPPSPRSPAEGFAGHMRFRTINLGLSIALISTVAMAETAKKPTQRSDPSRTNIEVGPPPAEGT